MDNSSGQNAPRTHRYQSLDFWRGVACLMIVISHATAYAHEGYSEAALASRNMAKQVGWLGVIVDRTTQLFGIGVPIFFVISGYCIAASCDAARRKPRGMKTFFFRRFRRIFPPYWIYLGVVALVFAIAFVIGRPEVVTGLKATLQNPWRMEFWQYIGTFFLTATWQDRLVGKGGMMSGQAWSLCYEEQFYFVSGLLLWSCPRRIFTGFAVITAAVLAIYLGSPALGWDLHGFFFDGFWLLFAAGVLVYYRVNYTETRRARLIEVFLFLTFCAFLWAHPSSTWYNRYFYPAGLGFAVLLCWLHPWDEAISTSRLLSPVTFCGRMCYSLYLIHVPIVAIGGKLIYENGVQGFWPTMLVAVPVLTILSVASAHLFAVFVERRFLNQPLTVTKPDSASARSRNWWAFGLGRSPFSQGSPAQSPQEAT